MRFRFSLRCLLLLFVTVAIVLWLYPTKRSASCPVTLISPPAGAATPAMEQTHIALIRSPFVIRAALRGMDTQQLDVLADKPDSVAWIQEHLTVSTPDSADPASIAAEISIEAREGERAELQQLVDAIAGAYQREIYAQEANAGG